MSRGRSRSGSLVGSGAKIPISLRVKTLSNPRLLVNLRAIQKTLKSEDADLARTLQQQQTELLNLKTELTTSIKRNFVLEGELKVIDNKIGLLIQNRVSVAEVTAQMQRLTSEAQASEVALPPEQRELYSSLFYLLQREPNYLGTIPKVVKLSQTPAFIQAVAFTLFGDQYSAREELLLLSVFRKALAEEFTESTSMGSLLRGNSAVTKMIRQYTRRDPGQAYLEKTLSGVLEEFVASDPESFEINPAKVAKQLINDEEVATGVKSTLTDMSEEERLKDPRVLAVIEPRIEMIKAQCATFMRSVLGSLEDLPFGIRWLAKQIAIMTKERFPEATRKARAMMVGGFVYLRFINPAIVTPDADSYKLVRNKLTSKVRRNLVLVAKVLQNLSNFILFGDKEAYMLPFNEFIQQYMEPLTKFFEDLTDVPDLEEYLKIDHQFVDVASNHAPTITISLNEIYLIHSLLEENLAEVAGDLDDPIRDLMASLGPAPAQLKSSENQSVVLELTPPQNSQFADKAMDEDDTTAATLYEEAKQAVQDLLVHLDTHVIPFSIHHTLETILEAAHEHLSRTNDADLALLVSSIEDKLSGLETEGVLSRNDPHSRLLLEISQQTENRASFEESLVKDRAKIDRTLERVRSHHAYLLSQLESYQMYLQNVRSQQGSSDSSSKSTKKSKKKKKSKDSVGPFKLSHDKLVKDGVIAETRVPEARRKKTMFVFSSDEPGVVDISATYHGFSVDKMRFELDDLLERQENDERVIVLEYVTLDVNLFLHLINKLFG